MRTDEELAAEVARFREQLKPHMFNEAEVRYQRDPDFHAAVELVRHLALQHGFTPYELKQIAFTAASINEAQATRSFRIDFAARNGKPEEPR